MGEPDPLKWWAWWTSPSRPIPPSDEAATGTTPNLSPMGTTSETVLNNWRPSTCSRPSHRVGRRRIAACLRLRGQFIEVTSIANPSVRKLNARTVGHDPIRV